MSRNLRGLSDSGLTQLDEAFSAYLVPWLKNSSVLYIS